jgi:hypothetical protein
MLIYKFRITLEENDNFLREIEIKPNQTFEDFHNALLECTTLEVEQLASFFICDIQWRKHQEITLIRTEEENEDHESKQVLPVPRLMSETTLNDCIDNPNAQLIYLNDQALVHTFYIELFKIYDSMEEAATFPRCVKRISDLPKQAKNIPLQGPVGYDDEKEEAVDEFDEEFDESQIDDETDLEFDDILEDTNPNENI